MFVGEVILSHAFRCAPSPLVGEGWGEGYLSTRHTAWRDRYPSPGLHLTMQSGLSHKGRGEPGMWWELLYGAQVKLAAPVTGPAL